jgi:hypothetical protein
MKGEATPYGCDILAEDEDASKMRRVGSGRRRFSWLFFGCEAHC